MRQVSRTVVTVAVAFLLMILPQALRVEYNSLDSQQIRRNTENSMHQMANKLEKGLPLRLAETKSISKAFIEMGEYVRKETESIKSESGITSIYFNFSK